MNSSAAKTPAEQLATPIQYVKGVGPARAELLLRLGLRRASDVLFFFPRDYQDMSRLATVAELSEDEPASLEGIVEEIDERNTGTGRSMLGLLIRQNTEYVRALWFNQSFMRPKFAMGQRVLLIGQPRRNGMRWEFVHPKVEWLQPDQEIGSGRILPVYPLTEGLNQGQMRRIVAGVVEHYGSFVEETLPDDVLDACNLWPIQAALPQIHTPRNTEALEQARRRFIFQELFVQQLALAMRRASLARDNNAPALPCSARVDARITRLFPFELTADQRRAIDEICADVALATPMNRLLQGDVGSGKTVVAEYALLLAVANQCQAVLMAPTEVLAQQHIRTLTRDLRESRVRLGLLTGSQSAAERRQLLAAIRGGEIDIVIGTQSLLNKEVEFARLGLVVIDEQHKFGVHQRAALRRAGQDPHYLVMTATPIPRTMSMTAFGDLEVSSLRETPPNRQPVHTYLGEPDKRDSWWEFVRKKLGEGRQGYVVAPLVDATEDAEAVGVEQLFERLTNGELEAFRLGMVHGRMKPVEKEAVMQAFRDGAIQALVATSVVEVGVDVPNATVMTIEGGERFGLAQLHQLRGRVSRGPHPGFVCVFADLANDDARQRLEAFVATTDGFALAELDFKLRGPGDLFSGKQHGLPPLRIADLLRDADTLEEARQAAQRFINTDADLSAPHFARLKRQVLNRYGEALEIGDVG